MLEPLSTIMAMAFGILATMQKTVRQRPCTTILARLSARRSGMYRRITKQKPDAAKKLKNRNAERARKMGIEYLKGKGINLDNKK